MTWRVLCSSAYLSARPDAAAPFMDDRIEVGAWRSEAFVTNPTGASPGAREKPRFPHEVRDGRLSRNMVDA
jgi:hypothetical protein